MMSMQQRLGVCALATLAFATMAQAQTSDPLAAWRTIAGVMTSPRCLNCHPRDNGPTQGDDMHRHRPSVQRGSYDAGVAAMRCSTCHQDRDQAIARMPGAPHWQLAPASMGWVGLSPGALCRTVKDRSRN